MLLSCLVPGELRKSARRAFSLSLSDSSPPELLPPPPPPLRSCALLEPVVCLLSLSLPLPAMKCPAADAAASSAASSLCTV